MSSEVQVRADEKMRLEQTSEGMREPGIWGKKTQTSNLSDICHNPSFKSCLVSPYNFKMSNLRTSQVFRGIQEKWCLTVCLPSPIQSKYLSWTVTRIISQRFKGRLSSRGPDKRSWSNVSTPRRRPWEEMMVQSLGEPYLQKLVDLQEEGQH
jgi:hypothetical protein